MAIVAADAQQKAVSFSTMASLLISVPDPDEATAILAEFSRRGLASQEMVVGVITCRYLQELDMLLAVGGNGKTEYGIRAQYLIDRCRDVEVLACVGSAGRLSDAIGMGDVVVASATIEHDYKKRISPGPLPRHEVDRQCFKEFMHTTRVNAFPFPVHLGVVASGDEDIVDPVRASELRALTDALCVAWEGSGGARAARLNGIGFVEIRGITDGADADTPMHFRQNLDIAMANVAQFLLAWHACREAGE